MITIEDVRIYLFIAAFVAAGVAIIVYAWKNPTNAMKLLCMVAVIAMGLIAFAGAEPAKEELFDKVTTVNFKRVEPALFNGEAVLRIWFNYHDTWLSWYDDVFLPYVEYNITIFAGEEVIDAEPAVDAVSR